MGDDKKLVIDLFGEVESESAEWLTMKHLLCKPEGRADQGQGQQEIEYYEGSTITIPRKIWNGARQILNGQELLPVGSIVQVDFTPTRDQIGLYMSHVYNKKDLHIDGLAISNVQRIGQNKLIPIKIR